MNVSTFEPEHFPLKHTKVPPLSVLPYKTASDILDWTPRWTRSSHTPSQLHSSWWDGWSLMVPPMTDVWFVRNFFRCERQAFQAPGLPAASNGRASRDDSSSKVYFTYSKTSLMLAGGCCEEASCAFENCRVWACVIGTNVVGFWWSAYALRLWASSSDWGNFLDDAPEETILFCALPNQKGKPCLKLNPPGGSLSSSVALTVSELKDPVV